jgi:hypothetical protein
MAQLSSIQRAELERKLNGLRTQHRDLDDAIDALGNMTVQDSLQIQRLKRQKLQLKDQIVRLENSLVPDIIA